MMGTNNGQVSCGGAERSGGPSTAASRPDPEVPEKAKRRQSVPSYSERGRWVPGAGPDVAAALEGLYSLAPDGMARARREGSLKALAKPRGPIATVTIERAAAQRECGNGSSRRRRSSIQPPSCWGDTGRRTPTTNESGRGNAGSHRWPGSGVPGSSCLGTGNRRAKARSSRRPLPCALAQERTQVLDTLHGSVPGPSPCGGVRHLWRRGRYRSIRTMSTTPTKCRPQHPLGSRRVGCGPGT